MSKIQIAKIVSIIFHPFIWISLSFFIVAVKEFKTLFTVLPITLLVLAFPFALLGIFIKKGLASNIYLTNKKERGRFIALISVILLPIFVVSLLFLNLPKSIILIMLLLLINMSLYFFLSHFVKISAHIGIVNSIAISLSLLYGTHFLLLILLEIPIAWARYTLKHHSIAEMFLAFTLTSIITIFAFIVL